MQEVRMRLDRSKRSKARRSPMPMASTALWSAHLPSMLATTLAPERRPGSRCVWVRIQRFGLASVRTLSLINSCSRQPARFHSSRVRCFMTGLAAADEFRCRYEAPTPSLLFAAQGSSPVPATVSSVYSPRRARWSFPVAEAKLLCRPDREQTSQARVRCRRHPSFGARSVSVLPLQVCSDSFSNYSENSARCRSQRPRILRLFDGSDVLGYSDCCLSKSKQPNS